MHDYNRDHFRFVRTTGLRRSDFNQDTPNRGDKMALVVAVVLLCLLLAGYL